MHAPAEQMSPAVHAEHVAPPKPHADAVEPGLQMPFASQQPRQLLGLQVDGCSAGPQPAAPRTTRRAVS